jgi:hypothetical protein
MTVVKAQARRGKRGPNDIILLLPDGKIAFPRGFTPREWEWYDVEIEDRGKYAIARLHQHHPGESGICTVCGKVVDYAKLEGFATRWLGNMLLSDRIKRIKETEALVLGYFDTMISDLDEMIERLDKATEPHRRSVNMCPPGYPTVDSCFADLCADRECVALEAAIVYLERVRDGLKERRWRATRALDYDRIDTVTPFGVERIFVPGI